ncbi:MAG: methyltransferase domain-containing protein [Verrucomicrobia bacterium]|nr:methyltransferase domain-containing protein [Verrucomicrobiota bacterium]
MKTIFSTERAVKERYAGAANAAEAQLCCPVNYDPKYLKIIPEEVVAKDYGCGDPSRYLRPGETVLDLGSGTGKICFIASQVVGPQGRVIGIDMTDSMLEVARRNAPLVAERIGHSNVEFRKGRIQDLALDLERLDRELKENPIRDAASFLSAEELADDLRVKHPLVANDSMDVVVSNCVLNLVESAAKKKLFSEIHRVLKRGGRAVISDIVSDEDVPEELQNDPELWSGCISGALREDLFLKAFEEAGFYGITLLKHDAQPWRVVQGIEFRSVTIEAFKGKQGPCFERNQTVIYKGPFKEVLDDDQHRLRRGDRVAVCDKTYQLYKKPPYREFFEFVDPVQAVALEHAKPFDCARTALRHPKETKGQDYNLTTPPGKCCDGGNGCS